MFAKKAKQLGNWRTIRVNLTEGFRGVEVKGERGMANNSAKCPWSIVGEVGTHGQTAGLAACLWSFSSVQVLYRCSVINGPFIGQTYELDVGDAAD